MEVIRSMNKDTIVVNVNDYRSALRAVDKITGWMSRSDFSSTIGYAKPEEYTVDMEIWALWLKGHEEGCR